MRLISYLFWGIIGVGLIVLGLANRQVVELQALPPSLSTPLGISLETEVPLFMVIMLGVGIGLLVGFLWEWLREWKLRAAHGKTRKQKRALERELERMKAEKSEGKDEVLALLE